MQKKLMLIVNPVAGKGQARNQLYDIVSVLSGGGYTVTVFITEQSGDGTKFVIEHGLEYSIIACTGGDGTLSEIVNGLMTFPPELRPPVGYIPLGTANDVSNSLNLSRTPRKAAADIVAGQPVSIDVGGFQDRYFMYIAAFGAMTSVSYSTPQATKNALGHLAYILEGIAQLPNITAHRVHVEYDGNSLDGDFIFGSVTNSTSVAGFVKLDPSAVGLNDGFFEVLLVKNPVSFAELSAIILDIGSQNYSSDKVVLLHAKRISFTFENPVSWTTDGESGGIHQHVETKNHHLAVSMLL